MLASYQSGQRALTLREIHRFTNSLQKVDGFDCWDLDSLEGEFAAGWKKSVSRAS
jgi:rhamnulokinase